MNDKDYMRKCFELAKKARGKTLTNPLVGAVLVKNNEIISTGFIMSMEKLMRKLIVLII